MKKKPVVNQKSEHPNQLQDLLANSAIYKAIWDNSINALFIATPEGQTLAANQAACRMFGYSEKELIEVGREAIIRHDDAFVKIMDDRKEKGNTTGEITCIRKNGEHFNCKLSSAFIIENNRKIVFTTMMEDISEQRKAEKLLDNTNRLANVGGWELDIATNKIYWTPVTRQIHEVDEQFEVTSEAMNQFYKDKNDNSLIRSAMEHGEPVDIEMQILTAKGNERWIRMTAKPEYTSDTLVKYYGSIQDITNIKLAEFELIQSRQEYKSIFDNSADAIFSLNSQGIILIANQSTTELFECTNEDLIGKSIVHFTPQEQALAFAEDHSEVLRGSTLRNAIREIITAKGNKKTISISVAPIKINNQVVGGSVIARNITEQQHYQQELEFHSRLLNTIHQAVKVVDMEGKVIYWNDYSTKLYGWTREETLGKKIDTFHHRIMSEELTKEVRKKLLKGEAWSGELMVQHKNNRTFHAFVFDSPFKDEAGNTIGILTISFDNTKEVASRHQIEFQSQLLSTIQQAVKVVDLEGKVIYWNDYSTELYGWTPEEAIGKTITELKLAVVTEELYADMSKKLLNGEKWTGELTMRHKNGSTLIAHISDSPITDEAGNLIGIITVSYDITKEVEAREYIELQAELLNTIQQAVSVVDLEGNITYWSNYATELFGWQREEVLGKALIPLAIPPAFQEQAVSIANMMSTGQKWSGEFPVITKAGKIIPVYAFDSPMQDKQGNLKGTIITCFDNTEEVEKRNQIQFQAKLLKTIQQAVVVYSATDATISYWNEYATELYGWTREEMVGKSITEIIPIDRSEERDQQMWFELTNGRVWKGEISLQTKEKKKIIVSSTHSPMMDQQGNLTSVITIADNITTVVEARNHIHFQANLLNTIQQAVVVTDPEGRIVYLNEHAIKMYGWSRDEAYGRNVVEIGVAENSVDEANTIIEKLKDGETWSGELHVKTKDNTRFISQVFDSPIKDENGNLTGSIFVSFDKTEEIEKRNHIQFQAKLLSTIQEAVMVFDLNNNITYWNDFATKLYGWKREEVIGKNVLDMVPPDLSSTDIKELKEKAWSKEGWSGELTFLTKEKKKIITHVSHAPLLDEEQNMLGLISVTFDITKEVKARDYIHFQAKLLDMVEQAVFSADLNGKINYWNRHAERLYGWSRDEMIGEQAQAKVPIHPSMSEDREAIFAAVEHGKSWTGELMVQHKNGHFLPIFGIVSPAFDENQKPIGLISLTYDISARKEREREKEIERLNKEALINTSDESIWSMDKELKMLAGNKKFLDEMKKLGKREFRKGDLLLYSGLIPEDYYKFLFQLYQRGLSGESFSMEFESFINARWFEYSVNPIFDHHEVIGIACRSKDITNRKNQEREKEVELSDKEALINTTVDYIWSMGKNHNLLAANDAFQGVIKYLTNKEFQRGDHVTMNGIFPDTYSQFFEDSYQRALLGESSTVEFLSPVTRKWFELTAHPIISREEIIGVACYLKNITERKLGEEEVRISNERYEFLAKATHDCIWDWNIQSNESQWAGNGMETLFGYPLQEVLANSINFWNQHLHADDSKRVHESLQDIFSDPEQHTWVCEYRFLKADGTYAYVYDKGYVIRDENNKPIRMIGAMQDISHRKEAELQLKNLNDKLEKKARDLQESNSELERFAYVASHDLQEPLRMVTSFLQLLDERFKDNPDPKAHQFLNFAVDGAKRMKQLIFDLLEYSRVGTTKDKLGETDMNDVVRGVLNVFKLKIEETNASITYGRLPVLPNTRHTQMTQLMQNLIGNALKYNTREKPEIIIDVKEEANNWLFSIKDNGIGFENQFSQKIFDIFQRLHGPSQYSGTGIGLSICKKIVERHGGKIWAESTEAVGSTFFFSFPKIASV